MPFPKYIPPSASLLFIGMVALGCGDPTGVRNHLQISGSPDTADGDWISVTVGYVSACGIDRLGDVWCWGSNFTGWLGTEHRSYAMIPPSRVMGFSSLRLRRIVAGIRFQCALAADGQAFCWGENTQGQLGRGHVSTLEPAPAPVAGGIRFESLSAGSFHVCGVSITGTAYCWGNASGGALGIGSALTRCDDTGHSACNVPTPMEVAGGLTFTEVSAGRHHTCGVTATADAYCWGDGSSGQLGIDDPALECGYFGNHVPCFRYEPLRVSGDLQFKQVAAAAIHSCGITTGGAAYCWGLATRDSAIGAAALGNAAYSGHGAGSARGSRIPVPVAGGRVFRAISAGNGVSCGLTTDSRAMCWGSNNHGQLGIGHGLEPRFSTFPRDVVMPAAEFPPALGEDANGCTLTTLGRIFCWGGNNFFGELGSLPMSEPLRRLCFRGIPTPLGASDSAAPCW
ncbi:MAG: RCC1 domain-containing protein [Gemmatimonadaceae bacterium]